MKVKVSALSHVRLFVTPWTVAHQAPLPMELSRQEYWNSPGKNTRVGCHSLLQGIFPTQGSNLGRFVLQANSLPSESPGSSKAKKKGLPQWCSGLRLYVSKVGGPVSIPGRGIIPCKPQLRVCILPLKILCAATKI